MEDGQRHSRNRALWLVRLITAGTVSAALALTVGFANLAEAFFSGKSPAPPSPPKVSVAAVPVQQPRPVIVTIVQHPYQPQAPSRSTAPQPPAKAPVAAPPPPPPPICHSTPSKPC